MNKYLLEAHLQSGVSYVNYKHFTLLSHKPFCTIVLAKVYFLFYTTLVIMFVFYQRLRAILVLKITPNLMDVQ